PLAVLEQLGVEVVDHDLPAADAAVLVAPGGEGDRAVVHLLRETGTLGRPAIGDRAEVDLVRGQPCLGDRAGLTVGAQVLQVAERALVEAAAARFATTAAIGRLGLVTGPRGG